jgi:hypothetical protein
MEKLLNRLLDQRTQLAHAAMSPTEKTEFEYGRVSGLYNGLTMAIEVVQEMLDDRHEDDA